MNLQRGDVVKIMYDHHFFSHGIYLAPGKIIIHYVDNDVAEVNPDAVVDVYFNIPNKTDEEYKHILGNFICQL